jgi:hypothetical protein
VRIPAGFDDGNDGRRDVLGGEAGKVRRIGVQHFRDAGNLRRCLGRSLRVAARDEDVQVAADLLRRGDRVEHRSLQRRVIVVGNDEYGHGRLVR